MNLYQASQLVDESKKQQQYEENFMRVNPLSAIIGAGRTKTKDGPYQSKTNRTAPGLKNTGSISTLGQPRRLLRQLAHPQRCQSYLGLWTPLWSHRQVRFLLLRMELY